MDEQELTDMKRANEEHATRLLEERRRVQKTRGSLDDKSCQGKGEESKAAAPALFAREDSGSGSRDRNGLPHPLHTPPVLGIGAGGHDPTVSSQSEPASAVADSPTAVDFDVYDRAYAEEVKRIESSGGRPSLYTTRHLRQNYAQEERD